MRGFTPFCWRGLPPSNLMREAQFQAVFVRESGVADDMVPALRFQTASNFTRLRFS